MPAKFEASSMDEVIEERIGAITGGLKRNPGIIMSAIKGNFKPARDFLQMALTPFREIDAAKQREIDALQDEIIRLRAGGKP